MGIRMGIVPIAYAGHCAELTAGPGEAKTEPTARRFTNYDVQECKEKSHRA